VSLSVGEEDRLISLRARCLKSDTDSWLKSWKSRLEPYLCQDQTTVRVLVKHRGGHANRAGGMMHDVP
jgi:hypothetical protein